MSLDGLFSDDFAPAALSLSGDFYREPDDICRGITFDSSTFGGFDSIDVLPGPWEPFKNIDAPSSVHKFQERAHRFEDLKAGRRVPDDTFFYFERTTQHLPRVSPSKAGNCVLDFLEQEIPSSITKVNDKKFTIKAEAFNGSLSCQIKVYIYQQESGCAVEFQRRSGDAIAFACIYEKAAAYLCEHTALHSPELKPEYPEATSATASPGVPENLCPKGLDAPEDFLVEAAVENYVTVLLDMPRQTCHQQDELASLLLDIQDEDNLQKLNAWCKPEIFEVLLELLATDRFRAAYPAALMLTRLAELPQAQAHFVNQGLLKSVLLRLWIQATGLAVWIPLAQVVNNIVSRYAALMSGQERQEIAAAIDATLQYEPLENKLMSSERTACVGQRLREALYMLDSCPSKASQRSLLHFAH